MKNILFVLILILMDPVVNAQPSWSYSVAFVLRDNKNEKVNFETFKNEYKIADVMGKIIPENELDEYIVYNTTTSQFLLTIHTSGPRFSFAIYHYDECMAIYFPFRKSINQKKLGESYFYSLDFKFRRGTYLFDFEIQNSEKTYLRSNVPYYIIKRINWRKQSRKFEKSEYAMSEVNCDQLKERY